MSWFRTVRARFGAKQTCISRSIRWTASPPEHLPVSLFLSLSRSPSPTQSLFISGVFTAKAVRRAVDIECLLDLTQGCSALLPNICFPEMFSSVAMTIFFKLLTCIMYIMLFSVNVRDFRFTSRYVKSEVTVR